MNELLNIYINHGISLFPTGENAVIVPIAIADNIMDFTENSNLSILGGDLYKKSNAHFEHTYDNWYYEGNSQEESIQQARNYLIDLKNKDLYVSFIFK